MGKPSKELKDFIVRERLVKKKSYRQIEREHGVLQGTVHTWVKRYQEGTLHIDKRKIEHKEAREIQEYEFLKKCFALLKEIRSKRQE